MVIPIGLHQPRSAGVDSLNHFASDGSVQVLNLMASSKAYFAPNRWASAGDKILLEEPAAVAEIVCHCKVHQHLFDMRAPRRQAWAKQVSDEQGDDLCAHRVHSGSVHLDRGPRCLLHCSPTGFCGVSHSSCAVISPASQGFSYFEVYISVGHTCVYIHIYTEVSCWVSGYGVQSMQRGCRCIASVYIGLGFCIYIYIYICLVFRLGDASRRVFHDKLM